MSEEQERLLREGDGFLASQVSFDLDGPQKPVRRKGKKDATDKASKKRLEEGHVTECPGCAADIPEGEFVEAILSFVTGSADYLAGDPVRVRSVQMLQQLVSQGRLPDPHSEWSLEVVQRLQQHIEHMADERARLIHRQEDGFLDGFPQQGINVEEIRASLRAEIEQEIVGQVAVAIRDQVRQQVVEEMVPAIRAEVEKELWSEFEDAMRNERAKHESSD
ncbi:MAG: hypothetical protein OSB33_01020 [Candidatus Poseidoniales archaeon]|nr:hypothetical protein [Candidatus Poseidoniales archaeon]